MSLVEVLVGIAVMMPLTVSAITGLMLAVNTSSANEIRQGLEVTLATSTEGLKALPYLPCGSSEEYQKLLAVWDEPVAAKVVDGPGPATPVIASVQYWNRGKGAYTDACGGDDGAQLITVELIDRGVTTSGSVVKRDAAARVGSSG